MSYVTLYGTTILQNGRQPWRWYLWAVIEIHALLGVRLCGRVVQWCQRRRLGT